MKLAVEERAKQPTALRQLFFTRSSIDDWSAGTAESQPAQPEDLGGH
jgi:hypothetical protein